MTTVTDHVWNDGQNSIIWGPGIWTRDGVEIGRTFPDGVVQPGGVESHDWDMITLDLAPNDFHFDAQVLYPDNPVTYSFWVNWDTVFNDDLTIDFELFTFDTTTNYNVMIDLIENNAIITDMDTGIDLYDGDADPFIGGAPLPDGFEGAGSSRQMNVPTPGTLAMMTLGGLATLGRRRR